MACYFFRLPGELRNKIYGYALTTARPLLHAADRENVFRLWCYTSEAEVGPHHESNQLRFVNRQLYAETRGLSIQYNDLLFTNFKDAAVFLETYKHVERHMKCIYIHGSGRTKKLWEDDTDVRQVASLLRKHPHIALRVVLQHDGPNDEWTLPRVISHEITIKQTHAYADKFFVDEHREPLLWDVMNQLESARFHATPAVFPANLRFLFMDELFDPSLLRKKIEGNESVMRVVVPKVRDGVDGWVRLMAQAVEEGV